MSRQAIKRTADRLAFRLALAVGGIFLAVQGMREMRDQ
jgi:hypothetical protein